MKDRSQMEHMAQVAQREAGWDPVTMERQPIKGSNGLGGLSSEFDADQEREDRAYAEGVEAGILWALGDARQPFPR